MSRLIARDSSAEQAPIIYFEVFDHVDHGALNKINLAFAHRYVDGDGNIGIGFRQPYDGHDNVDGMQVFLIELCNLLCPVENMDQCIS